MEKGKEGQVYEYNEGGTELFTIALFRTEPVIRTGHSETRREEAQPRHRRDEASGR